MTRKTYKRVMTVAGSDPSGGAGVQADIKTISACGCFATSAIVAVVDENTLGVTGVHPLPLDFAEGQIRSILDDIGTDSVKIGMLHSSELTERVRKTLDDYPELTDIVLDPVMVATSGDPLLRADAVAAIRELLIPRSMVITPNIPEAEMLLGERIAGEEDMADAAAALSRLGASVLLKGGHMDSDSVTDVFFNRESGELLRTARGRIATRNTHGTGCTLSSALASFLAKGFPLDRAVELALDYVRRAIEAGAGYDIGRGHGPVHHFHSFWE